MVKWMVPPQIKAGASYSSFGVLFFCFLSLSLSLILKTVVVIVYHSTTDTIFCGLDICIRFSEVIKLNAIDIGASESSSLPPLPHQCVLIINSVFNSPYCKINHKRITNAFVLMHAYRYRTQKIIYTLLARTILAEHGIQYCESTVLYVQTRTIN